MVKLLTGDEGNNDEEVYLDMDFSMSKKKKKKKAKDLDELVSEKQEDEKSDDKENGKWISFALMFGSGGKDVFIFCSFSPLHVLQMWN